MALQLTFPVPGLEPSIAAPGASIENTTAARPTQAGRQRHSQDSSVKAYFLF